MFFSAYKIAGVMDLSGVFQFVSQAVPGSQHDIELLRKTKIEIENNLDQRDCLVADNAYQGFDNERCVGTWFVKKRKTKSSSLPKEDQIYNAKLESIRRQIEKEFGKIKSTFECLLHPWRHDRSWLSPVSRFCIAVHNSKIRLERNSDEYEIKWNHPIPKLCNPRLLRKQVVLF